jgi:hypothetical protein
MKASNLKITLKLRREDIVCHPCDLLLGEALGYYNRLSKRFFVDIKAVRLTDAI